MDRVAPMILELVNDIVENLKFPAVWEDNFLALLAKVDFPGKTRRPPPDLC